jgi:poly(3-hydroxybutyrate) depolymerase
MLVSLRLFGQSLPCGSSPCDTGIATTTWNNITRYFDAYFPPGISPYNPYPLFVFLNGADVHPYNTPKLDQQSVLQGFAVANKVAVLWVLSTCEQESTPFALCDSNHSPGQWTWDINFFDSYFGYSPDDVGYINNMIANATASWGADGSRVMLLGLSTGGIEAHRFAQVHPSMMLGVGVWAGPLWAQDGSLVPDYPTGPTNVYIEHGDVDTTLPYCGGLTSQPWTGLSNISSAGVDTTFNYWVTALNCGTPSPNLSLCSGGNPTGVTNKTAAECAGGVSVTFVDDHGVGHAGIGPTYQGLIAFWNFLFPEHPAQLQPTTSTLVANPNPAAVWQPVSLTATVTSAFGLPSGTVTFLKNGTVALGTAPLSGGQAVVVSSFGTMNTKSITAVYSGSPAYAASTSSVFLEGIGGDPTATTLASSINPAGVGQSITLTATVSSTFGEPTGTVTFMKSGTEELGTVPLNGGVAALNKVFNTQGTRSITAVYSGDATFAASSSTPLQQVVQ